VMLISSGGRKVRAVCYQQHASTSWQLALLHHVQPHLVLAKRSLRNYHIGHAPEACRIAAGWCWVLFTLFQCHNTHSHATNTCLQYTC
jgi:hypothetical protein